MTEISGYFEAIKDRYALTSDYTLAEKLGIAQPDANLMRRGLKVPKPELCIKIAKLLDRNPVELLLIAQKEGRGNRQGIETAGVTNPDL